MNALLLHNAEIKYEKLHLDKKWRIGSIEQSSGVLRNVKGNLVQIEDGPAAVTEDERC